MIGVYEACWHVLLSVYLMWMWWRGRKEPLYSQFWTERWGQVDAHLQSPIWFHCASMGEMRGAAPLVQALVDEGYRVFVTTLTPAGRTMVQDLFKASIDAKKIQVSYLPFEISSCVLRWIKQVKPRCAIMTEIDTWPVLLKNIRQQKIPLCLANARYSEKSLDRDRQHWWGMRTQIFQAYQLVLCKSKLHADRFKSLGCAHVEVVGETRFDMPIPQHLVDCAQQWVQRWRLHPTQRPVICFASAIVGEDEQFIDAMHQIKQLLVQAGKPAPLFIYVPRSPQRFNLVGNLLINSKLNMIKRSDIWDKQFQTQQEIDSLENIDVMLGDSLGEMFFYLALSQLVIVGSTFVPKNAHNVIEPLSLCKPVMIGMNMRGIEYPAIEAIEAGVLQQHFNIPSLVDAIVALMTNSEAYLQVVQKAKLFYAEHGGSAQKHLNYLKPWLAR
ncbi:MAG: hypothetical protein EXR35_10335 [Limnohabitans sp.]|nr:hypothetical protein [Limnohabitans sp.]